MALKTYMAGGTVFEFECCSKKESEEKLNRLMSGAPFAFFGYDEEVSHPWNNNTIEFLGDVNQRARVYFNNSEKCRGDDFVS